MLGLCIELDLKKHAQKIVDKMNATLVTKEKRLNNEAKQKQLKITEVSVTIGLNRIVYFML